MKEIPYVLLLPLALIILFTQCEKGTYHVNIPNDAFLAALIELGIDTNRDGFISINEAEAITILDVSYKDISDMTGIEAYINLDTLSCQSNQLTSLDVSNNPVLKELSCFNNKLTSLDISNNTALRELQCDNNQLTSLDVSNNTALDLLGCGLNQLTSLDVSSNTSLVWFVCDNNQLTSLDVSNNTALLYIFCPDNQLTSLDVSNNTALGELWCGSNLLTSFEVSANNGIKLLFINNMPTLNEVCVWTMPFPPEGVAVITDSSPNVYFTTECSE
jgi:Leucine-rich repeat (LRR) protein